MNIESDISPTWDYGMDVYGLPYGDPFAGSPSPNGWTVCGIVDSANCPYGLGAYKENGSWYCCCHTDSGGQLPYCKNRKAKNVKQRIPPHHKVKMN